MSDQARALQAPAAAGLPLADRLEASHLRFLITEAIIGTVMSGLVPALAIAVWRVPLPLPLLGDQSLASSLIPATVLPGFGMPIILTLVVRLRVRRGSVPALIWPLRTPYLARFLPGPLVLRGVASASFAILVLPPAGLLLMMACGVQVVSGAGFVGYNFVHGLALGALVVPPVVLRAFTDSSRGMSGVKALLF